MSDIPKVRWCELNVALWLVKKEKIVSRDEEDKNTR